MLVLLALGCQEPFGTDRHDLEGFRIAAVAVSPPAAAPGDVVVPHAVVITDDHPWSDVRPTLRWHWVDTTRDAVATLGPATPADAEGPAPTLVVPDDRRRLAVVATHGAAVYRAFLDLPAAAEPIALDGVDLGALDLAVDTVTAEALTPDARAALAATPTDVIPRGGFGRFTARTGDATPFLRWMSTAGGRFFELDRTNADWAAGDITVDDEDVIVGDALPDGAHTLLALAIGDDGASAFALRDFAVGEAPAALRTPSDRWMTAAAPVSAGWWSVALAADDASPTGLAVVDPVAIDPGTLPEVDPYGVEALGCVGVSGPFDPSWLADLRCARRDVVGARVIVEAR